MPYCLWKERQTSCAITECGALLVHRHLVYLIVECLTQHRTWIPQQKQRQQNEKKNEHSESEEIVRKRVCINYLPCNLMEIFAIYFPFCQWFFSSCSPDVSGFCFTWTFYALSRFTFDTHSLQYLGIRLASKKQSLLRKSSWKVWNQGIFFIHFVVFFFSLSFFGYDLTQTPSNSNETT